jgi:uncharacterized protein (DUF2342 family)
MAEMVTGGGPGIVDWETARRVAEWAVARRPLPAGYRPAAVEADFAELTAQD